MTEVESEPLAVVVGRNCRRLRTEAGVTQNKLAGHARFIGLRWTTSKVGDFESGRSNPTFATVIALSYALSTATGRQVALADLLESEDYVSIAENFDPRGSALADVVRGERTWSSFIVADVGNYTAQDAARIVKKAFKNMSNELKQYPWMGSLDMDDLLTLSNRHGLDETRLARRLNISEDVLAGASLRLWGKTFAEERDHRAGTNANPQKRGQVSRQLQTEIQAVLDGND